MASSATLCHDSTAKIVSKQCDILFPSRRSYHFSGSTRRIPTFWSSSSLSPCSSSLDSSYFLDDSPLCSATPLRFSGVPFSWEHLPGIPKKPVDISEKINSLEHLPLPPPTATQVSRTPSLSREDYGGGNGSNKKKTTAIRSDPFFDAYVECSKDDEGEDTSSQGSWNNESSKVSRSLSDRFGFVGLYASCKRTCAVDESIVAHRPSSFRSSNSYELINHRSRQLG